MSRGIGGPGITVKVNRSSTCGLAEEGNAIGISAEGFNVISNPFNSKPLVQNSQIGGSIWVTREAKDIYAVAKSGVSVLLRLDFEGFLLILDGNNNHIFLVCNILSVIYGHTYVSSCE
jgi:hypothetical protein